MPSQTTTFAFDMRSLFVPVMTHVNTGNLGDRRDVSQIPGRVAHPSCRPDARLRFEGAPSFRVLCERVGARRSSRTTTLAFDARSLFLPVTMRTTEQVSIRLPHVTLGARSVRALAFVRDVNG